MRILMLSANLGSYDVEAEWPEQFGAEVIRLTDRTFPPRPKAMTSRLQAGIPKMFGWQMFPGYDAYVWVDASRAPGNPDTAARLVDEMGPADLMVWRHPERGTVREEYDFVKTKLLAGNRYLTERYEAEWLEAQFQAVAGDGRYTDNVLYASTFFAYRPTRRVQAMMRAWWHHKTRYLLHDQLAWPYVIWEAGIQPVVREENIYTFAEMPITRRRR